MTQTIQRPRLDAAKEKIAAAMDSVRVFCNYVEWDKPAGQVWIDGEIGPDYFGLISAAEVRKALKAIGNQRAKIFLSTPGGSVDEGVGIFNAIAGHKPGCDIVVDSLAASMGSYILQAGRNRIVYENAMVMIHNPWGGMIGDAEQMRKEAEVLDKYGERLVGAYASRSGLPVAEIKRLMDAESWFVGREAVDAGFADQVVAADGWYETSTSKAAGYPNRIAAKARAAKARALAFL